MLKREKYIEKIKSFCLMDDTFMSKVFEDNIPAAELLLQIILKDDKLTVVEVHSQFTMTNLYGRSVRLDILACDASGKYFNVEVQREDKGASPRRARYNCSLVDTMISEKGTKFEELPDTCVIFITAHDILGQNKSLYTIHRRIDEGNALFEDGIEIIYVNSQIQDETELGRLMQDFYETDPGKMHYEQLAASVNHYKYESEGVKTMCKIMEELIDEGRAEGREEGRAEGRVEGVDVTIQILTMIAADEPIEVIHDKTGISIEKIEELKKLKSA